MTDARARQPKGIPVGGEFAANAHDEAAALDGFLFTGGDDEVTEKGEGSWESGGIISIELNDGTEVRFDTGSNYPTYIDPRYEAHADGTVTVRFAVPDADPGDYEDEENVISRFDDLDARNDFVEAKLADGYDPEQIQFIFQFTNGGTSAHEIRGNASEEGWADNRFGSLDYDVLVMGQPHDESDDWTASAKATMSDRNKWENGDVYGIVERRIDRSGNGVPGHMDQTYYGIIGSDAAEQEVAGA